MAKNPCRVSPGRSVCRVSAAGDRKLGRNVRNSGDPSASTCTSRQLFRWPPGCRNVVQLAEIMTRRCFKFGMKTDCCYPSTGSGTT